MSGRKIVKKSRLSQRKELASDHAETASISSSDDDHVVSIHVGPDTYSQSEGDNDDDDEEDLNDYRVVDSNNIMGKRKAMSDSEKVGKYLKIFVDTIGGEGTEEERMNRTNNIILLYNATKTTGKQNIDSDRILAYFLMMGLTVECLRVVLHVGFARLRKIRDCWNPEADLVDDESQLSKEDMDNITEYFDNSANFEDDVAAYAKLSYYLRKCVNKYSKISISVRMASYSSQGSDGSVDQKLDEQSDHEPVMKKIKRSHTPEKKAASDNDSIGSETSQQPLDLSNSIGIPSVSRRKAMTDAERMDKYFTIFVETLGGDGTGDQRMNRASNIVILYSTMKTTGKQNIDSDRIVAYLLGMGLSFECIKRVLRVGISRLRKIRDGWDNEGFNIETTDDELETAGEYLDDANNFEQDYTLAYWKLRCYLHYLLNRSKGISNELVDRMHEEDTGKRSSDSLSMNSDENYRVVMASGQSQDSSLGRLKPDNSRIEKHFKHFADIVGGIGTDEQKAIRAQNIIALYNSSKSIGRQNYESDRLLAYFMSLNLTMECLKHVLRVGVSRLRKIRDTWTADFYDNDQEASTFSPEELSHLAEYFDEHIEIDDDYMISYKKLRYYLQACIDNQSQMQPPESSLNAEE